MIVGPDIKRDGTRDPEGQCARPRNPKLGASEPRRRCDRHWINSKIGADSKATCTPMKQPRLHGHGASPRLISRDLSREPPEENDDRNDHAHQRIGQIHPEHSVWNSPAHFEEHECERAIADSPATPTEQTVAAHVCFPREEFADGRKVRQDARPIPEQEHRAK